LKAYKEREHATDFIRKGQILLRRASYYKTTEDIGRRDPDEGEARYRVPGPVESIIIDRVTGNVIGRRTEGGLINYSGVFINPVFLFCCSSNKVDRAYQREQFGPFIVEIYDTRQLLLSLRSALSKIDVPGRAVMWVDSFKVVYKKDEIMECRQDTRIRSFIGQKRPEFSRDREIRIAVCYSGTLGDAPENIKLSLPEPRRFCRWKLECEAIHWLTGRWR
jgi:hypothetical protein